MNKLIRGVAFVLALAIFTGVGGAVVTGIKIEGRIQDQIRVVQDKINGEIKKYGLKGQVEISLASFVRGQFSSDATYRVLIFPVARSGKAIELILSDSIEHGPWPVSRLKSLDFLPVVGVSNIKLTPLLPLQKLFDLFDGDKGPMNLTVIYSYDGASSYSGHISSASFDNRDISFRSSEILFHLRLGTFGDTQAFFKIPRLELTNGGTYISITDMELDSQSKNAETVFPVGDGIFAIGELSIRSPGSFVLIRDVRSKAVISETFGVLSMSNALEVFQIKVNGEEVGGFELSLSAKNLRAKELKSLTDLFKKIESSSGYEKTLIENSITGFVYALLEERPSVALDKFSYKSEYGNSSISLVVDLQKPSAYINNSQVWASAIASIKLEAYTSRSMLYSIAASISKEGKDYSDMPNKIIGYVVASGYGNIEGDSLVSRINYRSENGGTVNNNGKETSLQMLAQEDIFLGELLGLQSNTKPQSITPAQRAEFADELVELGKEQQPENEQQPGLQVTIPRFEGYPSGPLYAGEPVSLDLSNEKANEFRTRLRQAMPDTPSFAGEYVDAGWGCGTSCFVTTFVSKRTGKILDQSFGGEGGPWLKEFRPDSNLIHAEGFWDDSTYESPKFGKFFYVLQNEELKLIKKIQIPHLTADTAPGSDVSYSYLIDILNGGQHDASRNMQFKQAMQQQADAVGQSLIMQTAASATELLVSNDILSLNVLLNNLVKNPLVSHAAIYSVDNRTLAEAGSRPKQSLLGDTEGLYSTPITFQEVIVGHLRISLDTEQFAYVLAESQRAAVIPEQSRVKDQIQQQNLVQAQAQRKAIEEKKAQSLTEEAKKKAAQEASRKAAEDKKAQSLAELLAENTEYQQAIADTVGDQVAGNLDDLLIKLVSEQWQRPPSARNGMSVEVLIEMLPDGTISNASVTRSSGDRPFDNSAIAAVRNVGRILEMQQLDRATFDAMYRQRRVIFKPEDFSL